MSLSATMKNGTELVIQMGFPSRKSLLALELWQLPMSLTPSPPNAATATP